MIKVTDRDGETHELDWEPDQSLMEALRDNDMPVLASCGGCCSCATCHVFVESDHIEQLGRSEGEERELLEETEAFRPDRSRLACQIAHSGSLAGIAVTLAPEE
ncbi:2Fe-2S iron-sulfur cluster-binding protein [Georgenia subflava]|uniref:2Fe-2S iron-sulfur cluster binding domain-containing protein n=1 Tax=Georgenia subflava TaxID=1622177 RepID=A0A6N7EFU5_9MICO|nr:2Fe-2S iron-sulfur cluster-binding protein [Georgenia subflava]MPV35555.1 2Fe-2S iron-sulfur cluster binding domain-containing protein [Georgenia subflava]